MTKVLSTKRTPRSLKPSGTLIMLLPVVLVALASGCAEKKHARVIPWATAIQVRPNPVAVATNMATPDLAPDLTLDLKSPSGDLVGRRSGPARPRPAANDADDANVTAQPPTLAPQLSSQEIAAAQQEMNGSLGIAERILKATQGRQLTALQADMVSKISGFVRDARGAAKVGDWTSARNLAKKAQVLSEELTGVL